MKELKLTYSSLKTLCSSKNQLMQYVEEELSGATYYTVFFTDGPIYYYCEINDIDDASDISDFETNYKSGANQPLDKRDSITGQLRMRPRPVEASLQLNYIYFTTGTSTDFDNGGVTAWSINIPESGKTELIFHPDYNYYVTGGDFKLLDTPSADIEMKVVIAPGDANEHYFVRNKRINASLATFHCDSYSKFVKYYSAATILNKMVITFDHGASESVEFESRLKTFVGC